MPLEARLDLHLGCLVIDTGAKAYKEFSLRSVMEAAARVKTANYLKVCLEQ